MRIEIFSGLAAQIRRHAAQAFPDECCGLLLGRAGQVLEVVESPNVAARPDRAFEIEPAVLLATHRRARREAFDLLGCYHSHPTGDLAPSARDAARAVDPMIWLIASADALRGWRFEGAGAFAAIDLAILR